MASTGFPSTQSRIASSTSKKAGDVRVKLTVKYEDYKRFKADTTITFGGEVTPDPKAQPPKAQPPSSNSTKQTQIRPPDGPKAAIRRPMAVKTVTLPAVAGILPGTTPSLVRQAIPAFD